MNRQSTGFYDGLCVKLADRARVVIVRTVSPPRLGFAASRTRSHG
jgi:hypothetical protein